ncbi:MAG: stage III sporulation protein AB [Clostridiales bacterium]|nr:stage III sporulation protein AB [Clostridiales bacterium]
MQRLIGGGLVVLACVGGALHLTWQRREGLRTLEQLIAALLLMERELGRGEPDTETLLALAAQSAAGPASHFFRNVGEALNRNAERPLAALWREEGEALALPPAAKVAFDAVGQILGRYDAQEQRKGLHAVAQTLQEIFQSAKEEEKQTSRLTLALGSCGAVFLLVLLL